MRLLCSPPDEPAETEPCTSLKSVISGGVDEKEQASVDKQVNKLVIALGLEG